MALPHVVTGLIEKRAELAGQLEHHQALVRQLLIDLDAVDATLRLFDPEIALEEIKPKPLPARHAAYKGEVVRLVLGTLREAKRPVTCAELTQHLMASRGMNTADSRLVRTVSKRVGSCLRHHRKSGLLTSSKTIGGLIGWEIAK